MEQIAVSKFKATCLAILENVRKTRQPILVTRFGKPIAEIMPPPAEATPKSWLGSMAGTAEIRGDIIAPALDPEDWEALG
jgi:antitoxin (DNA-binding transcriptional repressor) of toxin-antitoxin stability system